MKKELLVLLAVIGLAVTGCERADTTVEEPAGTPSQVETNGTNNPQGQQPRQY